MKPPKCRGTLYGKSCVSLLWLGALLSWHSNMSMCRLSSLLFPAAPPLLLLLLSMKAPDFYSMCRLLFVIIFEESGACC